MMTLLTAVLILTLLHTVNCIGDLGLCSQTVENDYKYNVEELLSYAQSNETPIDIDMSVTVKYVDNNINRTLLLSDTKGKHESSNKYLQSDRRVCFMTLKARPGHRILLHFEKMNVGELTNGADWLRVFDSQSLYLIYNSQDALATDTDYESISQKVTVIFIGYPLYDSFEFVATEFTDVRALTNDCDDTQYLCSGEAPKCISLLLLCDGDYNCGVQNTNEESASNGCLASRTTPTATKLENTSVGADEQQPSYILAIALTTIFSVIFCTTSILVCMVSRAYYKRRQEHINAQHVHNMLPHQRRAIDNEYSRLPLSQSQLSTNPDSASLDIQHYQLLPERNSSTERQQIPLLNGLHTTSLNANGNHILSGNGVHTNGSLNNGRHSHRNRPRGGGGPDIRHTVYLDQNLGAVHTTPSNGHGPKLPRKKKLRNANTSASLPDHDDNPSTSQENNKHDTNSIHNGGLHKSPPEAALSDEAIAPPLPPKSSTGMTRHNSNPTKKKGNKSKADRSASLGSINTSSPRGSKAPAPYPRPKSSLPNQSREERQPRCLIGSFDPRSMPRAQSAGSNSSRFSSPDSANCSMVEPLSSTASVSYNNVPPGSNNTSRHSSSSDYPVSASSVSHSPTVNLSSDDFMNTTASSIVSQHLDGANNGSAVSNDQMDYVNLSSTSYPENTQLHLWES